MEISEKELAVINQIANNHMPDQRSIATNTGISLGLTNLIIKKLINKGCIKAKQLSSKKIQYLLTPQGFSEKAKKSYNFTVQTISSLKSMREKIQRLIITECQKGITEFIISGDGEVSDVVELAFKNIKNTNFNYSKVNGQDKVVLIVKNNNDKREIDVVSYLSES
ncbi:MAG: hypothetical protein LHV68_02020 [Elusimicrobia bacterium]|nr:hypothetical protein [Candidatus Liberimonas magnetica]